MKKKTKFLVTGADGQLAKEFIFTLNHLGFACIAPPEDQLDITDPHQVMAAFDRYKPDVLLSCAAYNQVDLAEEQPDLAFSVNSEAVGYLAAACKNYKVFLVHFSSDYVFDGQKSDVYTEDDRPAPINCYGKSKLKGEEAVKTLLKDYLIFRLSWVFGDGQQNFLYKLSQWAKKKKSLQIVNDEFSVPTCTEDVVRVVLAALDQGVKGTYHLTNSGHCSRYEWAKYYIEKKGIDTVVESVSSDHFPTKARRPLFTCMSNKNICQKLNIVIPTWQDAVDRIVDREREVKNVTT